MAYSARDYLVKIAAQINGIGQAVQGLQDVDQSAKKTDKSGKSLGQTLKGFVNVIGNAMKSLNKFVGDVIKQVTGFTTFSDLLSRGIDVAKEYAESAIDLADGLSETAKSLNKSTDQARAHEIALKAMGKSMDEINKSEDLKKTYEELTKFGESIELKQAQEGATNIEDLKNGITKVKVAAKYGFSQMYESFKIYAAEPLGKLKDMINNLAEKLGANIGKIADGAGKALAKLMPWIIKFGESVLRVGKQLIKWGKDLIGVFNDMSPTAKAAVAGVLVAIGLVTGAISPTMLLLFALWALIDDFIVWNKGGTSLLGDAWLTVVEVIQGVWAGLYIAYTILYDVFALIWNIASGISKIGESLGITGSFESMDYKGLDEYENTGIYKEIEAFLQKKRQEKEAKEASGGTTEYKSLTDTMHEDWGLSGNGNTYPNYAGAGGGGSGDTYETKSGAVYNSVGITVTGTSATSAANTVSDAVITQTQHNLESAWE